MLQRIKNLYHLFQAIIANIYYGFPSRKLKVIGITGTDGKTTTTHLIYHILKTAGKKASMVSSIYANIGGQTFDIGFHVTTPDPIPLQKLIKQSVDNGDEYLVLETTSHALDQNRVAFIKYQIGVITNITHEHLDYHKTYHNYLTTKARLLKQSKIALINSDDQSAGQLERLVKNWEKPIYRYGFKHKSDFRLSFDKPLTQFNRYNYLAASSVALILGIDEKLIDKALASFKLPAGRLEMVYDQDFKVIIDFAHTPNALKNVLPEIRRHYLHDGGRLIHVFGAAGLRDFSKRPSMGEESSRYADEIIITEEDYRTENLDEICQQIVKGIKKNKSYQIIKDRAEAIKKAMAMAKPKDVVFLTGKSHEKSLCRGKKEYPWDEFDAVRKVIDEKNSRE